MKNVKDINTIKSFIINYISLKILSNEFKVDTQIPSENLLAKKFMCSRLTARSAIIVLVHLGVLIAVKGSGHYVSKYAIQILLPPSYLSNHADEISNKQLYSSKVVKYYSTYFLKGEIIGEVYWEFNEKYANNILKTYSKEKDISKRIINSGIIGLKIAESLVNIKDKTFIKHQHFDENGEFIFEFSLNAKNIEEISKKIIYKM